MNSEIPVISCHELTKKFGSKVILDSLNINLPRGRIVGLLGPNGSGKTTLIKMMTGLLTPSSGSVEILGTKPDVETKKHVSYLPDRSYLNDWMTVKDLLNFWKDFYEDFNADRAKTMMAQLHISSKDRLKTLSKGTKEKVQLIMVMSRDADLYILDEPIGGVDPAARDYILHTILAGYSENSSILISTHLIYDIESILDDVIFLKGGKIFLCDTVDNIRKKQGKSVDELFREVFRCWEH